MTVIQYVCVCSMLMVTFPDTRSQMPVEMLHVYDSATILSQKQIEHVEVKLKCRCLFIDRAEVETNFCK